MGIRLKEVSGVERGNYDLLVSRSLEENETIVFRELIGKSGDCLSVFLNKGDRLLFSYDFPDEVSDPCKLTKIGKEWLKRTGRLEDDVSYGEATEKVINFYYENFGGLED